MRHVQRHERATVETGRHGRRKGLWCDAIPEAFQSDGTFFSWGVSSINFRLFIQFPSSVDSIGSSLIGWMPRVSLFLGLNHPHYFILIWHFGVVLPISRPASSPSFTVLPCPACLLIFTLRYRRQGNGIKWWVLDDLCLISASTGTW